MDTSLFSFWAKTGQSRAEDRSIEFHPLIYHLLDVAACAEALLRQEHLRVKRLAKACGVDADALAGCFVALIALHDIGKCARGFQGKVLHLWPDSLGPKPDRELSIRHDAAGIWLFDKHDKLAEIAEKLLPHLSPLSRLKIIQAVCGHHGEPINRHDDYPDIWAAFADHPQRKRDFLWRQHDNKHWLVLSSRLPDDPHHLFEVESKVFAPVLENGHRLTFALRANAAVTRKDEKGRPKRSDIVMDRLRAFPKGERAPARDRIAVEAGHDWLAGQGAKAGFCLDRVDVIAYRTEKIPRHRQRPIELGVLDLAGDITVETPDQFLQALTTGFGKAKGFGCGLMLIRRRR